MTETALVLFSGGQDSGTCLGHKPRAKSWHAYFGGAA
jgi:7-cyano-7-deazaguanine synthase in queuosine biosynthesis